MKMLLIRHGHHDWLGRELVGRKRRIPLNQLGHLQAKSIAAESSKFTAIHTSPLLRAWQTARYSARRNQLPIFFNHAFLEINFGSWTGKTFAELNGDPDWKIWNEERSKSRVPHGETIFQVQDRAVNGLKKIALSTAAGMVAIFSHGDVIKAALAHWLGLSLNLLHTLEIEPGSISTLTFPCRPENVLQINYLPNSTENLL